MNKYRADLHIHTLLSPCASLEMTPNNIVEKAKASGLNIIGITDHNSTKHGLLVKKLAEKEGIFTLTGAEVTTKEEVHCLVFFEQPEQLITFQQFIEENITRIPNSEEYYGYQPVIDENENILEMVPYYLPAALKVGIEKIQKRVEELNGLFIPAHIDRSVNGILSQLGFIPPSLKYDALGLSRHSSEKHVKEQYVIQNKITFIRNSDAHYPEQIGEIYTVFNLEEINFPEIKKALNQKDNRFCELP
ncbi:MAG: PHP domain-containing protein [Mariniphaga sp.]|jgi:PHP family Zn ribbon phosphoesterase|nr:PHP domain-containing protein [Mariniphaga sp.]